MARACVCYVIDNGYLLPALVSAAQARECVSPSLADVIIICIDNPTGGGLAARAVAYGYGIDLIFVDPTEISKLNIMFGRFFVHRLLPDRYDRIIYIDADTQIRGCLEPLVSVEIPVGDFLACRDPAVLFAQLSNSWFRRITSERREIGFARPYGDYFNSGVLVFDRKSWPTISDLCIGLLEDMGSKLRYPDQDILNLAVGDRCKLISNRWNFPGFLIGSRSERETDPRIYHFMSNPRPWNQAVPPWGEYWARPYTGMLEKHPELQLIAKTTPTHQTARYWLQQSYKFATEYRAAGLVSEPEPDIVV